MPIQNVVCSTAPAAEHQAFLNGASCVALLMDAGANPSPQWQGKTPLSIALERDWKAASLVESAARSA